MQTNFNILRVRGTEERSRPATSRLAIAAFVLSALPIPYCIVVNAVARDRPGLYAFLMGPAFAWVFWGLMCGFVLSLLSYGLVARSRRAIRGKSLAAVTPWFTVISFLIVVSGNMRHREKYRLASRVECMVNLKQIGRGLEAYRLEDPGRRLPYADSGTGGCKALSLLYPRFVSDPRVFLCSAEEAKRSIYYIHKPGMPLTTETCSYHYETGLPSAVAPSDVMIVWDRLASSHGKGRNVLFLDGHTKWMSESQFQKRLKAQRDAIETKRRNGTANGP